MLNLTLNHITKAFGDLVAVNDVSLCINGKQFIVIMGPSGSGKTTFLRLIAGLEEGGGSALIDGRKIETGDVAFVFQSEALFPHMTVFDNIAFGLKMARVDKRTIREKVTRAAEVLAISDKLDCLPSALSGGQKRRVALGRAMVLSPKLWILDEPLSGLDEALQDDLRNYIIKLYETTEASFFCVSHDVGDLKMATNVLIMRNGKVEQMGSPNEVYLKPNNLFVASTVGAINCFRGKISSGVLRVCGTNFPVRQGDGEVIVGLRPEFIKVGKGALTAVVTKTSGGVTEARISNEKASVFAGGAQVGDELALDFDRQRLLIFSLDGERL